jgi:MFS transporter, UMF1 family
VSFKRPSPVVAWALYDWANSAFATTVMAGFFPTFFSQYWSVGTNATTTTWRLGLANGIAGFIIAVLAPLLGVIADRSARRKQFVMGWTLLGVTATAALFFVAKGQWATAAVWFVLGTLGFNGGIVFYDSLLPQVATSREYDRVSALGYALGYLGGGLLFTVNVLMTLKPAWFGLNGAAEAVRYSFLTVAVWWLLFSLPLALWVREAPAHAMAAAGAADGSATSGLIASWRELLATLREISRQRALWLFLVAYWLYIDGVNTVIKMAVDYGMALGLPAASLLTALLITQFVAFPAAIVFGRLGERMGARRALLIGIAVYGALTLYAVFLDSVAEFYAMAIVVGLVQGGVQSLSRSLFSRQVPAGKSAEYFGFYNMMGKFATVIGPLLVGATAAITGSSRGSIAALLVLFIAGGWLLWRVPEEAGAGATR